MRCAALHRKLGTHISKVKSLSMDKWDNAQVDVRANPSGRSETALTTAEHEAHWQRRVEQDVQSPRREGPHTDRCRRGGRGHGALHTAEVRAARVHERLAAGHTTQHGQHEL